MVTNLLAIGWPGPTEMIIVMVIILVLFGGAKLPSLMRNMGRSINEFKSGMEEDVTKSKAPHDEQKPV